MTAARLLALGCAAAVLVSASPAAAQLGRFLPGRGYAVDGRDGPYLSQIDPDEISQRLGSGDALGFAAEAGNQGSHHGLRLRMPQTEAAIAALIGQVDGAWPHEPRRPVQVHILASGFYAPMALPDGSIMVPLGLLAQVESDDELAYILSHELAHVRLGHFADDQGFRAQRQTGQQLAQAYALAASLSQMRARTSGGQIQTYSADGASVDRHGGRAAAASEYLNVLVNVFAEPAWARGQEDQADALAFDLSEAAGFNGLDGADAAFGRMDADFNHRRELAEGVEAQLNETVGEVVTQENLMSAAAGNGEGVMRNLFGSFLRRGGQRAFGFMSGYFGQRHRPPDARSEGLGTYTDRAYPDRAGFLETSDARLRAIRAEHEYTEAEVTVGAMQAAQEARLAGDLPLALSEIARAQATLYGASAAVSNAAAAIHADAGNIDEADRLYSLGHAGEDQSLDGYVAHVRMLIVASRRDRARQIVDEGTRRFGGGDAGEKAFLPSLVAISLGDGREDEGMAYLRRCHAYAEERLSQDCTMAALSPGNPGQYQNLSPAARAEIDAQMREGRTGPDLDNIGDAVGALTGLFGRGG